MEDIQVYYYIPGNLLRYESKIEALVRKGDKTNREILAEINQTDKFCRDEKSITLSHFKGLINGDISLYAIYEGRIVGILLFAFNQNPQKQNYIIFDGICSPEKFKGLGVGKKLIDTLIMIGERNACNYIKLECKGRVMTYYRDKFGFRIINERVAEEDSDEDSEDERELYYDMILELKPISTEFGGKKTKRNKTKKKKRNKITKRNKKNKSNKRTKRH
jgi:GNAT superfamily N-acetyltransferase